MGSFAGLNSTVSTPLNISWEQFCSGLARNTMVILRIIIIKEVLNFCGKLSWLFKPQKFSLAKLSHIQHYENYYFSVISGDSHSSKGIFLRLMCIS